MTNYYKCEECGKDLDSVKVEIKDKVTADFRHKPLKQIGTECPNCGFWNLFREIK